MLGRGFGVTFAYRLCALPPKQRQEILTKVLLQNLTEPKAQALLDPPEPPKPPKAGKVCGVFSERLVLNSINNLAAQINKSGGKATVVTSVLENQTQYTLVLHGKGIAG